MNLELIKNNIIFRLITKKEFDRLTMRILQKQEMIMISCEKHM